jgi:hypothetical protein
MHSAMPARQGEVIMTTPHLSDDTPEPGTLNTLPDGLLFQNADMRTQRALQAAQARTDLGSAKGAASLLSEEELRELQSWIEMKLRRRAGF